MECEEFEKAVRTFEVVNRKSGGKAARDEVVFRWELTRAEFVQAIADHHPEVHDPEGFFDRHKEDILHRFQKGFDILVGECGSTYETLLNDAIDEALGLEQGKEPAATCPGAPGREQEENAGIQRSRQMIVAVAGQRIVDIYESENGRCWYITQRIHRQGQGFVSGYVRCLKAAVLAEFLHLPEEVLQDTGQRVWRVPPEAWWRCPCVDVTEERAGPTIIHCEGEWEGSRPSPSCIKVCTAVVEDGY
jgi:hypothetical protein